MVLGGGALAGRRLFAHRLDEYLQAARIAVDPARIELSLALTPGIEVADAVIAEIDRNRDGVVSTDEQETYAAAVLRSITLEQDDRTLQLERPTFSFPPLDAMRGGEGVIQLRTVAAVGSEPSGAHRLTFRNQYRRDISVYLANALAPADDRVTITAQIHSPDQRELTIEYAIRAGRTRLAITWTLVAAAVTLLLASWKRLMA